MKHISFFFAFFFTFP
ncbi:hypothetical protein INB67_004445 [Escherichia coli]|nr:pheA operon leader peptide PheL [Escherichia coli]EGJ6405276.1 hypothetical protein [Escherichia coli]EGJ6460793.1 hypothetical protein [Escherichia coli]EGJ6469633.1 hypothetical protein [Escherichia coli]EGJ6487725.1 hypothetical protein [Escherichia coli]EGJ6556806.1 hypothetical protein [Escherichia coli]